MDIPDGKGRVIVAHAYIVRRAITGMGAMTVGEDLKRPKCQKCGLGVDVNNCGTYPDNGGYYHHDCADGALYPDD